MTDENIQVTNEKAEKETCNCFCKSEGFRKFIVVALGSFTGVFCAIKLQIFTTTLQSCSVRF